MKNGIDVTILREEVLALMELRFIWLPQIIKSHRIQQKQEKEEAAENTYIRIVTIEASSTILSWSLTSHFHHLHRGCRSSSLELYLSQITWNHHDQQKSCRWKEVSCKTISEQIRLNIYFSNNRKSYKIIITYQ
jgi:hypothetical protein